MAHVPAKLAESVEALSSFRRFNALLAWSLTGRSKPNALLRRMEDGNLLPIRVNLDDPLTWFPLHPLFKNLWRPHGPTC
ncbi:hypothetical protein [Caballeronia grimmiae]|uniref:hypothetical protein n=1 Tax=Caballeronia grimmiae TaxID=1071679 RepID=UPI0038BC6AA6